MRKSKKFRVIAIIVAYNEGDIISHVIKHLIENNLEVYLINYDSTDNTVEEASKWLDKGLIHIESFPQDAGYPMENRNIFHFRDILKRKEELSYRLGADWYLHHDADEFRESPWPGISLREGIEFVDALGYNYIDFELLNFRPTDNNFKPGEDVRRYLHYYEPSEEFDCPRRNCWKNFGQQINLVGRGGHDVEFDGRKIFPVKFILRHYRIRSQEHGYRKVFLERVPRWDKKEKDKGWHIQYDGLLPNHNFIYDPAKLSYYDEKKTKQELLHKGGYHPVNKKELVEKVFNCAGTGLFLTLLKRNEIELKEEKQKLVAELELEIAKLEAGIHALEDSLGHRMLMKYRRVKTRLLPLNSRRRAVYEWCLKQIKS